MDEIARFFGTATLPEGTMIVTTADLYKFAYGKYVILAYNVNNLEQILGMRGLW